MLGVLDVTQNVCPNVRGQGRPARTMRGHKNSMLAFAFFKDGRRVITATNDGTLRIWDLQDGALLGEPFRHQTNGVFSVAISPDERRIASGGYETIIIWDVEDNQMVFGRLLKHTNWVYSVCFSPDGKRLASGTGDDTVLVRDVETGTVLATLDHPYTTYSLAFSPDGLKLACGSYVIRVWRTDNSELLLEISADSLIRSVAWSPDGQQLVSVSDNKKVNFWNLLNGDKIGELRTGHIRSTGIDSITISSDGFFITTSSDDKIVQLWTQTTKGQALEPTMGVESVVISSNEELPVSGDDRGKVWLQSIKDILEQGEEERITEGEDAQRQQLLFRSDTQIFVIHKTVRNAFIGGDLHTVEHLLTQEINGDVNNHNSYANRSVARARNSEWDNALQDAVKSIAIQPSLLGCISKGIALCGKQQLWDAMEAFDLAFVFSNRDPVIIDLLLLIKAISLFNANHHDEAMRRVQELAQHSDALPCSIINSYLRVELAKIAFEDERYSEAADRLKDSIPSITDLFSRKILVDPGLKIFTVLFGWDFDSLWQTANKIRCDAFLRADRVTEAVESYQYMTSKIDEAAEDTCLEWSTALLWDHCLAFKKNCTAHCISKGDEALATSNYETAVELYSLGIGLDSSCESLFVRRSKVNIERNLHAEALHDAEKVIELNPSSYLGYEVKHAALHNVRRYDEAIEAFNIMLSKLDDAPDPQIRKLRQNYVSPSEVDSTTRQVIQAQLENAPLRLLDTSTGHLCSREAQINAFMKSTEYKEILSFSVTRAPFRTKPIEEAVARYFSWVMLSHRWESKEPLLHDIQDKAIYDFDPVGTMVKLQTFCKTARDMGHRWAWSDTCCIDQNNPVELERSVNSMFVWYRHSALTIIYLSDVPPSSKSGALANSTWNTRGWTIPEFLAPNVVLFYQADWTLYLDDRSPNHKESVAIMQELEEATGIDAEALVAFRPGMSVAREKLRWASTRVTTLQEDIAYSLFGIFGVHLPVIYGEAKQNALGRLLQEIVAQSGDITTLDWVGRSSEFNSCLPADITSYKSPPYSPPFLSEDQMQTSISSLRDAILVKLASTLYARLDNLSAPRFANRRLHLPCIAFPVTAVRRRRSRDGESHPTYEVKADGLQDMSITTEDKLVQFSRARSTRQPFLLVRPWSRYDLELSDLVDEAQSADDDWSEPQSPSDTSLSGSHGEDEPVDLEFHSRALRLIVHLGQRFGALLLAQQRGGEYKRIASDHNIIAQVRDVASIHDMMDVRILEIL
ncbi:hypothetical protein BDR05DRAFT_981412 [Suillus weaverae]|nr:hypothetical protein BDR05DRAFT_981412 [Suillus weaverae]